MTVILGIDPGSNVTGYGIIRQNANQLSYISSGCIRIKEKVLSQRLQNIYQNISIVVQKYSPDEVGIEDVFVHHNPRGSIQLGQARGVAIVAASQDDIPVYEYSPRSIKKAVVGYGAADKDQVQNMVKRLLCIHEPLASDASDALAVALCHAFHRKTIRLFSQDKKQNEGTVS